jgi:hypothetical protein
LLTGKILNRLDDLVLHTELQDSIMGTFLQDESVIMVEKLISPGQNDWITYLLLILLAGLSIIFFKLPERISGIFSQLSILGQAKTTDRNMNNPGPVVYGYLMLNYLITVSLYIYVVLTFFDLTPDFLSMGYRYLLMIAAVVLILFVYRIALIRFLGVLFKTRLPAYFQQQLYVSTDFFIGMLLIPFVLLSIYIQHDFLFFTGMIIIFIIHIFRWFQSFLLGKSTSGVFTIHLIVYLCTLEIAPLIVVIKLMQTF